MADYGASDTSTTSLGTNQFPISEAWTPNAGFSAVEGGTQTTDAGGKKSAPVRVEVKDGSDLTQGAQADAAYTSGSGSIISLLKGIFGKVAGTLTISGAVTTSGTVTEANSAASKTDLDTIVTNTNKIPASPATEGGHLATIDTSTANANTAIGTKTDSKATDGSVTAWSVIALLKGIIDKLLNTLAVTQSGTWTVQPGNTTNTTPWLVNAQRNTVAVYSLASTVTTGSTQNSGDLAVGPYAELSIDINTTAQAGTSPTIQYFYERKGADGIYYVLWQSAVLTAAANTLSTSIGAGMAYNQSLGVTGRLRWVIGGSATPTFTHTANIQGK